MLFWKPSTCSPKDESDKVKAIKEETTKNANTVSENESRHGNSVVIDPERKVLVHFHLCSPSMQDFKLVEKVYQQTNVKEQRCLHPELTPIRSNKYLKTTPLISSDTHDLRFPEFIKAGSPKTPSSPNNDKKSFQSLNFRKSSSTNSFNSLESYYNNNSNNLERSNHSRDFSDADTVADEDIDEILKFEPYTIKIIPREGIIIFEETKKLCNNLNRADSGDEKSELTLPPDISRYGQTNNNVKRNGECSETYELTPTKYQSHKDHVEKVFHEIRAASLEAAVQAYQNVNLDVPDLILAQINSERNEIKRVDLYDDYDVSSDSKKILLGAGDEIHASPCQCALNMVGMNDFGNNYPPKIPLLSSFHKSQSFSTIDFHEITLINRNNEPRKHSLLIRKDGLNSKEEFLNWNTVTIRCSTHDEMDMLIEQIKNSSNANVIPFSCIPVNSKRAKRKPSYKSVPSKPKEIGKMSTSSHNNSQRPEMKTITEKRPWDINFNKKEYCELCDLHFTLLTRRHHCRKCDRSCCGHCSSVMVVKGGDEKRYCNRCNGDILRKQSKEVYKRLSSKSKRDLVLPGKVHEACDKLGVGKMGKLPHWKHYLKVNSRPAVGRITVELLEAMALPSVDMLNANPYIRATITGYDRDMTWELREWEKRNRFSLITGYCTSTLSPQWRGPGRKGGELLTLPVISTAGAVLRLEVLHYNEITHSRGKDRVLGVVEIPLSDLPNANLREPNEFTIKSTSDQQKKSNYDGYSSRWYRLDKPDSENIILSKPIPSPHSKINRNEEKETFDKNGAKSLEEIGKRIQGVLIGPVEWFASVIQLDLPIRRPEAVCEEHKSKAMLHVRIKLNASEVGDLLSHVHFPPVKPYPSIPPYDPEVLFNKILLVGKLLDPYFKIIEFIEKCIRWKHDLRTCIYAYLIFAAHLVVIPQLIPILHIYLIIFLILRLKTMKTDIDDIDADDSSQDQSLNLSRSYESDNNLNIDNTIAPITPIQESKPPNPIPVSPSLNELVAQTPNRNSGKANNHNTLVTKKLRNSNGASDSITPNKESKEEENAKLNVAVSWIAKRLGDNKGLEKLQFKLTRLSFDARNVNSVWDGSKPLLTRAAILYLASSFVLHFCMNRRLLWLIGTFVWYFARSPICIIIARMVLGFWRGVAKIIRRQQLLDSEMIDEYPNILSNDSRTSL